MRRHPSRKDRAVLRVLEIARERGRAEVTANELMDATRLGPGSLYPRLLRLAGTGAIVKTTAETDDGRVRWALPAPWRPPK